MQAKNVSTQAGRRRSRPGDPELRPDTPSIGRRLTELQRTIGNRATSSILALEPQGAATTTNAPPNEEPLPKPVSADELIGPVTDALEGISAVQFAEMWSDIQWHLMIPTVPKEATPLSEAFPELFEESLVESLRLLPMLQQAVLVLAVRTATSQSVKEKVAEETVEALEAFSGLNYKNSWPSIESQIADPQPLPQKRWRRTQMQKSFTALYEPPHLDELKALDAVGRAYVSAAVEKALITRIAQAPPETVSEEYEQLESFVKRNIEKGERGYVACRQALMDTFGSVEGINAYYTKEIVRFDFLGRGITVHKALKERLEAAVGLLDSTEGDGGQTWGEIARASLRSAGGFNIRENRNSPTNLSFHSFGWAVDLNAPQNPNVKKGVFRQSPFEEFTDLDLFGGEEYRAIRAGGTAAEILPHATTMREASQKYEDAFESEEALIDALAEYLTGEGLLHQDWMKGDLWPTLERAGAAKKHSTKIQILADWVQYTRNSS